MNFEFQIKHVHGGTESLSLPLDEVRESIEALLYELDRDADDEHYQVYIAAQDEAIAAIEGGLFVYSSTRRGDVFCRPRDVVDAVQILVAFIQGQDIDDRFGSETPPPNPAPMHLPSFDRLMQAASSGNLRLVQELIELGVGVNGRDSSGGTPLMVATLEGHYTVCEYLLQHGADPKASDNEGESVESLAREYPQILELLSRYPSEAP